MRHDINYTYKTIRKGKLITRSTTDQWDSEEEITSERFIDRMHENFNNIIITNVKNIRIDAGKSANKDFDQL